MNLVRSRNRGKKSGGMNVYIPDNEPPLESSSLKFSSDGDFTLSAPKNWDGTLEYTLDNGSTWTTWDGSQLSGTADQPIYLRGIGNTIITGGNYPWTFTGKYCTGNIENLLDYDTVKSGEHPVMGNICYTNMFKDCISLTTAPELPATTLVMSCYKRMFEGCTSLTTTPELPATTLGEICYAEMFKGCTSLTTPPELPATKLAGSCYKRMFEGCTNLTTLPELPSIKLPTSCYESMFRGCTSIKISETQTDEYPYEYRIPTTGTGTKSDMALDFMFEATGGTFTDRPTINTTYYTTNQPV